jgi:hypothetical protein
LSNSCIEYCSWAAQYPIEAITREGHANGKNVCDDSSIYLEIDIGVVTEFIRLELLEYFSF